MKNQNRIMNSWVCAVFATIFAHLSFAQGEGASMRSSSNHSESIAEKDADYFRLAAISRNTQTSEFGGYPVGEHYFFCSSVRLSELAFRKDELTGNPLYSLMYTSGKAAEWNTPKRAENESKVHVGPICALPDGKSVIVTIDDLEKKSNGNKRRLKLYSAIVSQNGKLSNFKELPFNGTDFSNGHPSVSTDGKTLYFASDRPGGFGGTDIYKVSIGENGTFGLPQNLGNSINSSGNELFPWISSGNDMLFFASNGHGGYGGLDVFIAYHSNTTWNNISNLGSSINSVADDFAFILLSDEKNGYVSSNRTNGKGEDDIYCFELSKSLKQQYVIEGKVVDKHAKAALNEAEITLLDASGTVLQTTKTDAQGNFHFSLEPNSNYVISTNIPRYYTTSYEISTNDMESGDTKEQKVEVEKDPKHGLTASVTDRNTGEVIAGVKVHLTDNITGEDIGIFFTNELGEMATAVPGKKLQERISYNIELSKEGYLTNTRTYNAKIDRDGPVSLQEVLDVSMVKFEKGVDIGKVYELQPIYFDYNQFLIRPDAALELDKIVKIMNENPAMYIELGSHTDARGSAEANLKLSDKRAKASADYIRTRISNPSRITGKGYGESHLLNNCGDNINCTEEQHAVNRRTEFVIK